MTDLEHLAEMRRRVAAAIDKAEDANLAIDFVFIQSGRTEASLGVLDSQAEAAQKANNEALAELNALREMLKEARP